LLQDHSLLACRYTGIKTIANCTETLIFVQRWAITSLISYKY